MWLEEQGGSPMALLNSLAFLDTSPSLEAVYGCIFLCRIVENSVQRYHCNK